ncbi:tape measure protein [Aquamicrobium segne]|uniref:Tape measure protein n=1 Tax=Aquamicrobium segne TaxID=469547 RepID=A0ABW0GWD0_9HYPH
MDLATLGLAVDSRPVADASKDLDRIREAAARAEKQADSFGKRVEDAGKRAAAANDNAAKAAGRAAKAYDGYSKAARLAAKAIGAVVGAAIGKALIDFADTWSDLNARVGLAVRDMDASGAVMDRLAAVARRTYSALDLTAESYIRNASVLRELGKSTAEQLDYTEALNLALVVSGAKGDHAARVQDALGKAMAAGKLRGEELNTVIERGGRVAEILAEELGISQNQLRKLGSEGKITGDTIYNALTKRLQQLQDEAESMPATIGDGLLLIRNALLQFIGSADQASGASETFASGLIAIADNIGRIVTYVATAVTAFGTYYVAAMVAAYVSTMTLSGALVFLRGALIRTGIGALVIGAGELVYQFGRLVSAAGGFGNAVGLLGDVAAEVWERIKLDGESLVLGLQALWAKIGTAWLELMAFMQERWANFLHNVAGAARNLTHIPGMEGIADSLSESAIRAGSAFYETKSAIGEARAEAERLSAASDEAAKKALAPLESIAAIRKALADASTGEIPNTPGVRSPTTPDIDKAAEKAKKAYDKIVLGAKEFIAAQELERQALGMTEVEANRLRYTQDLLNQATRASIDLDTLAADGIRTKRQELTDLAAQMAAAEQETIAAAETQKAYNDAAQSMGGVFKGLLDRTKDWKDALLDLIPVVLKLLNTMNVAQGGQGIFGGGLFQSFIGSLLGIGFQSGGYTGAGAASQPAGIVHAGEYVFSKSAVDRIGLGYLDSLHSAAKGYMAGGLVSRLYAPANTNLRGFERGGFVPRAQGYGTNAAVAQAPARLDVYVHAEEGKMFRPVIRAESQGVAVKVVQAAAPGIMEGSVTATQAAARQKPGLFR